MDINKLWKNEQNARFIKVSGDGSMLFLSLPVRCLNDRLIKLFPLGMNQLHFLHQLASPCVFIDYKHDKADIYHDVPANGRIIIYITHGSFPCTVKVESNQVAVSIKRRAAGISSRGMIGGYKANRHSSIFPIWFKILFLVELS